LAPFWSSRAARSPEFLPNATCSGALVGAGIDPTVMRVCDVMTKGVLTVAPEATVEEVMGIFTEKRCRHLPVMKDGRLLGMISIGDASRWLSDLHRDEAEHLKSYIAGGLSA